MGLKRQGWIAAIGIIVLLLIAGSAFADSQKKVKIKRPAILERCISGHVFVIVLYNGMATTTQVFEGRSSYSSNTERSLPKRCK